MGSNRFNKVPDYTPRVEKEKPKEVVLIFQACCVCNEPVNTGYYGRWGEGGTCSKKCETKREDMQLYMGDKQ